MTTLTKKATKWLNEGFKSVISEIVGWMPRFLTLVLALTLGAILVALGWTFYDTIDKGLSYFNERAAEQITVVETTIVQPEAMEASRQDSAVKTATTTRPSSMPLVTLSILLSAQLLFIGIVIWGMTTLIRGE